MIKVKKENQKDSVIIEIVGHANYAPIGQDIVCSAVSILFQTLVLSLDHLKADYIVIGATNKQKLKVVDLSKEINLLVGSFFIGVSAIADNYPDYVSVN